MLKLEVERNAQKNVRHTQKHRSGFLTAKVVDYSKYPTLGTDFSKRIVLFLVIHIFLWTRARSHCLWACWFNVLPLFFPHGFIAVYYIV